MKDYRLVAEDVPSVKKSVVYDDILKEFSSGKATSVRVESKKKASTLHQGLLKAKRLGDYGKVDVVRRGDLVYLRRG